MKAIAVLEKLEDEIDSQTYDERRKRDFDDPDDCVYTVEITAGLYRKIGKVLRDFQADTEVKP